MPAVFAFLFKALKVPALYIGKLLVEKLLLALAEWWQERKAKKEKEAAFAVLEKQFREAKLPEDKEKAFREIRRLNRNK